MDFFIDPIMGASYPAPKIGTHVVERTEVESTPVMHCPADLSLLVGEYQALVPRPLADVYTPAAIDRLAEDLVREAEWTADAAETLIGLVKAYGSFMLRNAAALAIALGVDDGDLAF